MKGPSSNNANSPAAFWKTRAGRAGEVARAEKAGVPLERFGPGDFTKFQCRGCGSPGPRLCVCDDNFDKLIAQVKRDEDRFSNESIPKARR